jgi:steroid delta-isomerase-like uncharacterized protein
MSVDENKALVLKYIDELLVRGRFDHAQELVGPDFKIDRSAVPETISGPEGLHKQMDTLKEAFPDLEFTVADVFGEGDRVAVRFVVPGTHKNTFAGIPATGRRVTWKGIAIYRVADNRIQEAWACWDDVGLLQSLK